MRRSQLFGKNYSLCKGSDQDADLCTHIRCKLYYNNLNHLNPNAAERSALMNMALDRGYKYYDELFQACSDEISELFLRCLKDPLFEVSYVEQVINTFPCRQPAPNVPLTFVVLHCFAKMMYIFFKDFRFKLRELLVSLLVDHMPKESEALSQLLAF